MLNRDTPWFDYETWAAETSTSKSTTFTWEHSYDGLNWPRDGRELLRVRARQPAYWKAENLDIFDGAALAALGGQLRRARVPEDNPRLVERWTQQIKVSIRNLRTDQFITAGYALDVDIPRLHDGPDARRPRRSRRARCAAATPTPPTVYTPRPIGEPAPPLERSDYDESLQQLHVGHRGHARHHRARRAPSLTFPFFGSERRPSIAASRRGWHGSATPEAARCSAPAYARTYAAGPAAPADGARQPLRLRPSASTTTSRTAAGWMCSEDPAQARRCRWTRSCSATT